MRYAVLNGGKRVRPLLVYAAGECLGVDENLLDAPAVAIELIHAFSLVHDDLPAMDDDDLRRGQPTVHIRWDEATAVLVGDALQTLAFDLVTMGNLPADVRLELASNLAFVAGGRGMVRGQALDIAAETADAPQSLDEITELQSLKTGALIEWSAKAGPFMAGEDTSSMSDYATALGLAFQIADDILDVEGDEAKVGKRVGKDSRAGKATFVSHLGLDGAKRRARELVADAIDALCIYDARADHLRDAARFVISREF